VNVGIIGTGFGARVVAPVFAATEGCNVVDVVSPRNGAALIELVQRPDVDLVSVHSPPFLHARDVGCALESRKAVLCDKPFAMHAGEAAELLDQAVGAGVVHLVNFEFRCQPARVVLRDAVREGRIGHVEHVQWTHMSAGTRVPLRPYGWLFDAARGGGWIGAWASHAVDTLRWLLGEIDTLVSATRRIDLVERPDEQGVMRVCTAEDALTATLHVGGDISVALDSGYAAGASVAPRLTVFGSEGAVQVVGHERVTLVRGDGSREVLLESPPGNGDRHDDAMRRWAEGVRDAVDGHRAPPGAPTFADGHACDLVLDQLRAAPIV
jgi:predicted dehydrogenase